MKIPSYIIEKITGYNQTLKNNAFYIRKQKDGELIYSVIASNAQRIVEAKIGKEEFSDVLKKFHDSRGFSWREEVQRKFCEADTQDLISCYVNGFQNYLDAVMFQCIFAIAATRGHTVRSEDDYYYKQSIRYPIQKLNFWGTKREHSTKGEHKSKEGKNQLEFRPAEPVELSNATWVEAFNLLHKKISTEYAFTLWRGIDWDGLKNKFAKRIGDAQSIAKEKPNEAKAQYYQALREYMISLHDTHSAVLLDSDDELTKEFVDDEVTKHTNGSYGLIITHTTDNDKYIVSYLAPEGPAAQAGIKLGAEIKMWNNRPVSEAVELSALTWSNQFQFAFRTYSPSTKASSDYEKLRMLLCGCVDDKATIGFVNPTDSAKLKLTSTVTTVTLTATNDNGNILKRTALYSDSTSQLSLFFCGKYGCVKLIGEDDGDYSSLDIHVDEKESDLYKKFRNIMKILVSKNVPGVILDLRGNRGGDGKLGPDFASFFTKEKQFFSSIVMYNYESKNFDELPKDKFKGKFFIEPVEPYYSGPVVVLTDIATVSAGEFVAQSFKNISTKRDKPIKIMSFYPSTQGAFADNRILACMPENFEIMYQDARILDKNKNIMVDANKELRGGVPTDLQVLMTKDAAIRIYTGGKDVLLDCAIKYLDGVVKQLQEEWVGDGANNTDSDDEWWCEDLSEGCLVM